METKKRKKERLRKNNSQQNITYNTNYFSSKVISMSGKGKPLNRKDKQKLRQRHRQELELAKIEKQKQMARKELQRLQETGIVQAYESFLRNICKYGLPQPRNVYEMAAQHVLKHEKKMKQKQQKKDMILEYNSGVLKSNSPRPQQRTISPKKRAS